MVATIEQTTTATSSEQTTMPARPPYAPAFAIDRAVAAIAVAAEKNDRHGYRPVLQAVHVNGSRAYAADGFMGMAVDLPVDSLPATTPATIPAAAVTAAARLLLKGKAAAVGRIDVTPAPDGWGITLAVGATSTTTTRPDGTYPFDGLRGHIERHVEQPAARVGFDPEKMARLMQGFADAGVSVVIADIEGPNSGIRLHGYIGDHCGQKGKPCPVDARRVDAVLMPMVISAG